MKIVKAEAFGTKYGVKGDAQVGILFDPDIPADAGPYAWMFALEATEVKRRELSKGRHITIGVEYYYNTSDHKTHGQLIYSPRIDYGYDVGQWGMEEFDALVSVVEDYGRIVESMVGPARLAQRFSSMFEKLNVTPGISFEPSTQRFQVRISVGSYGYSDKNRKMPTYTKTSEFWTHRYESADERLDLTLAEMAAYDDKKADALVHRLADQLNDKMLREEAFTFLDDILKADGTGLSVYWARDATEFQLKSSLSSNSKVLTFTDGEDLMAKVKALGLEQLKKDLLHYEAEERIALDDDRRVLERKAELRAEKEAKQRLVDEWAALVGKAAELNAKVKGGRA